ncbi:SREBP regulating gene protein [Anopheles bellator]|uniref:SREBP regulating gene protein n=1 Tax=Anopheles bellator TaxID=139047 RepID=UPI002647324F|nr:SREBP regulating gene protein [Anopheles bellator]
MCYAVIAKFIRRRLVLAIIFLLSLSYCMIHLIRKNNNLSLNADFLQTQLLRHKAIVWTKIQPVQPLMGNETEEQSQVSCRNSVQGKSLLVDDRGFVCPRADLLQNGCCNVGEQKRLFSCKSCLPNHCCAVYEYCVSCCLHPNKRPILEAVLAKAIGRQVALYATVVDQFELCLTKCRTNSQSVQNENKYRNPEQKHCYGEMNEAWLPANEKNINKVSVDDV